MQWSRGGFWPEEVSELSSFMTTREGPAWARRGICWSHSWWQHLRCSVGNPVSPEPVEFQWVCPLQLQGGRQAPRARQPSSQSVSLHPRTPTPADPRDGM